VGRHYRRKRSHVSHTDPDQAGNERAPERGHPERASRPSTRFPGSRTWKLAALGACLVVTAVILVGLAVGEPGSRPHAQAAGTTLRRVSRADRASRAGRAAPARRAAPAGRPRATTPALAQPPHQNPLGAAAASYVSARTGIVLAAVYDVKTGQTWSLGQGQPQDEASVVKLDVLETLLAERGDGLPGTDQLLAQQMIEDSDNDAATSLWYAAGGAAGIRSFNQAAGLVHTSPSSCVDCPGFPWPGWGLTTTTPADQIALLRALVEPSTLLTPGDRSYALSLMENVTPAQRWGVSGGVPAQATVALKNGWLPLNAADTDWQINSVGWVSGQGRDYLMAVLTTGNPTEQYGIDTIDQLAAIVWAGMS
jgi:beta-lactamase class A